MVLEAGRKPFDIPKFSRPQAQYAVIIPYSSNVDFMDGKPQFRLSQHSEFVTDVARNMQRSGYVEKILLCGEQTFGKNHPVTTTSLMRDRLTSGEDAIDASFITSIEGRNLNSTPFQIRAIRDFQKQNKLEDSDLLLIDLSFHDQRIYNYLQAYHMQSATLPADITSVVFAPDLSIPIIPDAYLRRERKLQLLARSVDPKGYIPSLLTLIRGGRNQSGMIVDVTPTGQLEKIRGDKKLIRKR